jgi:hypothetical protein
LCERVLNDFVVFGCAEQYSNRRPLVGLFHVVVERLDVERAARMWKLPCLFGFRLAKEA